ncbi:MAG: hypothetical protein JJU45_02235 [Acidimicrobiia bacterium]|nr:hypothetical protein [Acidimicrobiia bacterium]
MGHVTGDGTLISDLWLDRPDAANRIAAKLEAGEITEREAEQLRGFADDGYIRFKTGIDAEFAAAFEDEVQRLWRE